MSTSLPEHEAINLERLATALQDLNAKVYIESVPDGLAFDCSGATLAHAQLWNLITDAGRLDIAFQPSGTHGYADLALGAVPFIVFGVEVHAASLEDILRSKEAAGRPQDLQDAVILREMLRMRSNR